MTLYDYLKFISALLLVLGMMGGLAILLKRFGLGSPSMMAADKRRLKVVEILHIDARRKAVLLMRDDVQHFIIMGPNSETVIETNIKPKDKTS